MKRYGPSFVARVLGVGALGVGVMATAGAAFAQVGSQIGEGFHSTGRAGLDTLGQTYNGMGSVASTPFRDFNVVHAKMPPPLERARIHPYDVRGLTSCGAVLNEVSELDLVLGPDIDTPDIEKHRNMYNNAADLAGSAAVDAMRSAVDHFIPMRDTIRKLTGAEREQKKMEKAVLSGKVRRGFLKSYGMQHNCAWPAAPAGFTPAPGGPVWTMVAVQVAPPPAPMTAAVIAAIIPGQPVGAASGAPAGAVLASTGGGASGAPGKPAVRGASLQVASAASPRTLRAAPASGAPVATETQAGAWRIGPAPANGMAPASPTYSHN